MIAFFFPFLLIRSTIFPREELPAPLPKKPPRQGEPAAPASLAAGSLTVSS